MARARRRKDWGGKCCGGGFTWSWAPPFIVEKGDEVRCHGGDRPASVVHRAGIRARRG
jgi:hypothetical protein